MAKRILFALFASFFGLPVAVAETREPRTSIEAQNVSDPRPVSPVWALQVTPYLWATGIKGDISPFKRAPTIGVEKSFSEVMDDLNFGSFINLWGRYEGFVFSGDLMYVDTTESKAVGALPVIGATPGLGAKIDTQQFTSTLQAGYRIFDTPDFSFDALGGLRFWHVSNDVTINYGPFARSYGESFAWVDPVIGVRAFMRMTDVLSVQALVDVGGFDIGSKVTWQALATVNYTFTDHLSASAGYKALKVDYNSGGHVFDTTLSGPVLGLTYRF